MPTTLEPPAATDGPEKLADYLELLALDPLEDGAAFHELVSQLGIGGTIDALDDDDQDDDDALEAIANAAFAEIDDRVLACGEGVYPFTAQPNLLTPAAAAADSVYLFLALLSRYGLTVGPLGLNGAQVFEDVCAHAARSYLGPGAEAVAFGFPRRGDMPPGFSAALQTLVHRMGEGGRPGGDALNMPDQNDGKLDVVAWKHFADGRAGKLIAFGQCATGANWRDKLSDIHDTKGWCQKWLRNIPLVGPVRFFFIPHRIPRDLWPGTAIDAGVIFDRCRIAQHASGLAADILAECRAWNAHVVASSLLAPPLTP